MKPITLIITILFPLSLFSQINGIVIDKKTDKPISFSNIWVENIYVGTTSDYDGKFIFNDSLINKNIIVSAIGYKTQKLLLAYTSNRVLLVPKSYEIEEIVIKPIKKKEKTVGKFKESEIEHYYSCGAKPWIAARYYPYQDEYAETSFLSQIEIMTRSYSDSAIFSLRLLSVNEQGEPSTDLLSENIIVHPKKGYSKTTLDLSEYVLKFPENGLFIATEFYVIDKNLYEYETISRETKEKVKAKDYGPLIGNILEKNYNNSWIYVFGEWRKPYRINSSKKKYKGKYWNLAITLKLTN
ncbi:MAG: carboxypeptidase-like regulatory domain-containing protein [Tenuifilaceae bacterium]|nr:carboxypeptidase-like regulatory domain-containing protein [Tenuifilaceae bacterium]